MSSFDDAFAALIGNLRANRPTSIVSLFFWRRPPAIAGFVVSVVVYAIDRHAERCVPHIGKERSKAGPPALANRYAPAAVQVVATVCRCIAALLHVRPDSIGSKFRFGVPLFSSGGDAVCGHFLGDSQSTAVASATGCISPGEVVEGSGRLIPACAMTEPIRMTRVSLGKRNSSQFPKCISGDITRSTHVRLC